MRELDPLLHSQLRLAVVSLLLSVEEADFSYLKDKTQATSGNLSVQIDKLSEAGYIEVRKEIIGKKPRTSCRLTDKGRDALNEYVSTLKEYLEDYASGETKALGEKFIKKEMEILESGEKIKTAVKDDLVKIEHGERDFRF